MKITYACGHTVEAPWGLASTLSHMRGSQRRTFIERIGENDLCPDCYNKAQQEKLAAQWQLPALAGTPRQVAYADKIRARVLVGRTRESVLKERFSYSERMDPAVARLAGLFLDYLLASGEARLWLDCFADAGALLPPPFKACVKKVWDKAPIDPDLMATEEQQAKLHGFVMGLDDARLAAIMGIGKEEDTPPESGGLEEIAAQIREEKTLRPESPVSTAVTEVTTPSAKIVCAHCEEKVQKMVDAVKGLRYRWNAAKRRWQLAITETNGPQRDRVVELCRALLDAGLIVRVPDLALLDAIENAGYEPVHPRWVIASDDGRLRLVWERGQDFAAVVRGIPRVRVFTNSANVPAAQYQSVLDFAGEYGFKIAPSAQAVIDKAVAAEKAQTAVEMKADTPTPEPLPKASTEIAERDAGKVEIDPSLRDGE